MKKTFKMEELDCANCAAKMERAIRDIPGVESASINFFAQKLTLCAPAEQMDAILDEAQRRCQRVEPDCRILR